MANYTKGHKVIGTMACGCKVIKHPDKTMDSFVDYCPKHKAAPALYEAAKVALAFFVAYDIENKVISGLSLQLNEALALAEKEG